MSYFEVEDGNYELDDRIFYDKKFFFLVYTSLGKRFFLSWKSYSIRLYVNIL